MTMWQFLCVVGIAFIILEIFTPSMFFLNFALAAFLTALSSVFITHKFTLVLIFFVLSFLSFVFLRPMLLKRNTKETETGIEGKYIGKSAKAIEDISENSGVITIYGERWEARSIDCSFIPAGSEVCIEKNDGLIMFVGVNKEHQ